MRNRLYFTTALKELKNKNHYLVHWNPFNGEIRNEDSDSIGGISSRVMDNLLNSGKLEYMGKGTGLLSHETYYKLKNESKTK